MMERLVEKIAEKTTYKVIKFLRKRGYEIRKISQ
jgi:hypothetical protein